MYCEVLHPSFTDVNKTIAYRQIQYDIAMYPHGEIIVGSVIAQSSFIMRDPCMNINYCLLYNGTAGSWPTYVMD